MNERIKLMVAHLLEKTVANGCTEAEQDAATSKIQELLSKYRISMADVEGVLMGVDDEVDQEFLAGGRSAGSWLTLLAGGVARANGCRAYRKVGRDTRILIYGSKVNRECAIWMFQHLKNQIDCMVVRNAMGRGRAFAAGYRQGLAIGVVKIVKAAAVAPASDRALVHLRRDESNLDQFERTLRLTSAPRRYRADAEGYERGRADASSLGVHQPIGGRAPLRLGHGR